MTYRFEPEKSVKSSSRELNPLGFTVTSYQTDREVRGMMKKLFIATCLLLHGLVYSAATPLPSGFDARMQTVSYNGANTTVIRSKTGFLTSVVFDEGEAVISAKAGFPAGWEITTDDNVVYINPRPVVQEQEGDEGEKLKKVFQPTEKEWDTNLLSEQQSGFTVWI